jgi:anti-sigma factor ChrR (cupin superfamily)
MASGEQSVIHRTGSIVGVIQEAQTSSQLPTVLQTTTRKINLWLGTANKRYDVFVSTKKSSDSALVLISAISLE